MKKKSLFKEAYQGLLHETPSSRLENKLGVWMAKKLEDGYSGPIVIKNASSHERLIPHEFYISKDGELTITVIPQTK